MSIKTRKILQPRYVSNFQCIGPACEDSCCVGWRVQIDKVTYKKYRQCPDSKLRTLTDEVVTRNRTNANDDDYAKIKLKEDKACPILDEDNLCILQRKLGEEYLSLTCTTYPRITNTVNGIHEKSLTISCPVAAQLALLQPDSMEFDESEENVKIRNTKGPVIDTNSPNLVYKPQKYFWELRIFIISLLQNRTFPLWQRLVILGLFCQNLDHMINDAKVSEIPLLIGSYLNDMEQGVFNENLINIPSEMTIQLELMKELTDQRLFEGVSSKRFVDCFVEFLNGIQYTAEDKKEDIGQRYATAYENYYKPFMEQHEYILENYLVNHVFKNLFPFSGEKHVFDNFVMFIVHYAMIKMLLIGMAGFHKETFSTDNVIKLVQSFSRVVEHNNAYLRKIFQLLKANQFNTLAYMAILIKN